MMLAKRKASAAGVASIFTCLQRIRPVKLPSGNGGFEQETGGGGGRYAHLSRGAVPVVATGTPRAPRAALVAWSAAHWYET
eukprot:scaffold17779_cov35-Tisochrysis_lutea.AAC.2